jgi:hypothetical protein
MTASVTTTSQNLLLRSPALPTSATLLPLPLTVPDSRHEYRAPETPPMLFRSECFAEDLFDSYPSH